MGLRVHFRLPAGMAAAVLVVLIACARTPSGEDAGASTWQVGVRPTIAVGYGDGSPDAELYRVQDALLRSDGSIVLTDGGLGSSRVVEFDATGSFVRVWGGSGEGPGEFRWTTGAMLGPDDSVFVFDAQHQRLTVFDPDGGVGRTVNLQTQLRADFRLRSVLPLRGGRWMGRELGFPRWADSPEVLYDTVVVGLLDASMTEFRAVTAIPGPMSSTVEFGGQRFLGSALFAPYPMVATWGRCVFTSTGATRTISIFGDDGALVSTIEGPGARRQVTQNDVDAHMAYRLEEAEPGRHEMIRARYRQSARMSEMPYYHQLVVDEWGHLWVQEWTPPLGLGASWVAISQAGELLSKTTLPTPLNVYSITEAGVLGRARDELDRERVELLPWEEPPSREALPLTQCS